ncbi:MULTISPECIES: OmpP1/FadL family transporter [Deefgea]|uniref:Transporter n=1 Tax=Deefgea chitinilytica TaxID=570276 RepID=A0ABS2CET9_9NEIS|nr:MULTISPECIES: outer membrane protein transport protein [Deefgea]MBM5571973.1 transporter [Deefgea chitinilytica]MBM9889208.1 outer membrane protein transport protein [Deefgea sp. CFH1-16]
MGKKISTPVWRATQFALAIAAVTAASAQAGGLLLYEVGTPDVGLAAAGYTARAQDAATVFTNPAGMTRLDGDQVTLGVQALFGRTKFNVDEANSSARLGNHGGGNATGFFPGGGLFYSHSVSPDFKVGLAMTGNFGLSVQYDDAWAGRYYTQEATLIGLSVVPAVAYRINDKLSLGASMNAMRSSFKTKVAINNLIGADGQLELDDSTWGFGANLGLLYEFTPSTRVGLNYHSQIKLDFDSQPQWRGVGPLLNAGLQRTGLQNANINLGMNVPQGFNAGIYHELDSQWALLGSLGWQQWSKFGEVDIGISSNNPRNLTTARDFKDTWHIAAGTQYRLSERYTLMGGIAYDSEFQDSSAIPPAIPANDTWRFGVGAQINESKALSWGLSLQYLYAGTLNTNLSAALPAGGLRGNLSGSYDRPAGILFMAANMNYKF